MSLFQIWCGRSTPRYSTVESTRVLRLRFPCLRILVLCDISHCRQVEWVIPTRYRLIDVLLVGDVHLKFENACNGWIYSQSGLPGLSRLQAMKASTATPASKTAHRPMRFQSTLLTCALTGGMGAIPSPDQTIVA